MSKDNGEKRVRQRRIKIMVFGTFDGIHPGHLDFFKQARKLARNPYLIVSIARDRNVFRIKGERPINHERARARLARRAVGVDEVVLSGVGDHLPHIKRAKPDIIALGYDQRAYVRGLVTDLARKNLKVKIVRLKPYKEKIYKNRLIRASTSRPGFGER